MNTVLTHEHETKRRALQATVFAQLTASQLDDVARLSDIRHIVAGGALCEENEFGQDTYVIAAGHVAVVADGVEVVRRGPGDIVGDWAIFGGGYRSATLRALSNVEVVVVDPRELDALLTAVPGAARLLGPQVQ